MLPLGFWKRLGRRASYSNKSRSSVRLGVEILEDRSVPATASGVVGGVAFADSDGSNVYQSSDIGLPGVTVALTGTTSQGTAVNATATTAGGGSFSFANVLPGTYQLSAVSVPGLIASAGSFSSVFTVSGGQTVTEDLGFQGGVDPHSITMRQFLTTTSDSNFPLAPPGSGAGQANYRPNNTPTVSSAIADQAVAVNSVATKIDLAGHFTDPDITNSQVTFNITNGTVSEPLTFTLFDTTAPQTVANFLDYVKSGDYNNAIFTRLISNFILQGGGVALNAAGNNLNAVPVLPGVPNEFGASNTADTLAMALSGSDINSGTNQFFVNLIDNSSTLDPQHFTVFGQIADIDSEVNLANLAGTSTKDESASAVAAANPSVDFANIPLTNYSGTQFPTDATASNYMVINSVSIDQQDEFLTYTATSSNPNVVTASVSNEWLTLNYAPNRTGSAVITVQATDRYGAVVTQTFNVTVSPQPPVVNSVTITPNSTTSTMTLTATPAATDPQGLPVTFTYQWLQNGTAIAGATTNILDLTSLTVAATDKFTVQVTPSDGTLTGATFTSNPVIIASINPITLAPPTVQAVIIAPDSATTTTTLTATATADPDPLGQPITFTYQWLQNGTPLAGATAQTLSLASTTVAVNDQFTVQVTPSDGTLTGTPYNSDAVKVATISPITLTPPAIQSVTIAPDDPTNATVLTAAVVEQVPATVTYQWFLNNQAISGATAPTFNLVPANVSAGDVYRVQVTANEGPLVGPAAISNNVIVNSINPIVTS